MKYVATIKREDWGLGAVKRILRGLDLKEAYIGRETGNGGYQHFQCCFDLGGDLARYCEENSLGWHIEDCVSWDESILYCRKDGNYCYLGNKIEEREYLRVARRPPLPIWKSFEQCLQNQRDREVSIWIDRQGSSGKSTWSYLVCRRGRGISIPRTEMSGNRMADFICMNYRNEEIIILDLPREEKLTEEHTKVLEDIKDGNLSTAKYQGTRKWIRGTKVIVFTNNWIEPKVYKTLTEDRWDIHVIHSVGSHPEGDD